MNLPAKLYTIEKSDGSILLDYLCEPKGLIEQTFGEDNLKERNYKVIEIVISKDIDKNLIMILEGLVSSCEKNVEMFEKSNMELSAHCSKAMSHAYQNVIKMLKDGTTMR